MAALVLETGAGVPGANSYADLAYADAYFESHPYYADNWAAIVDPDRRESLLMFGSRQLDVQFVWRGRRATTHQGLDWPRTYAYDNYDNLIGYNSVPEAVRQAACEMARFATTGDPYAGSGDTGGIEELRIDVIELKFGSSTPVTVVPSAVRDLLRPYGDYSRGIRVRRVLVG